MSTFEDEVLADLGRYRQTENAVMVAADLKRFFGDVTLREEGAERECRPPTRAPMPPA